MLVFVTGDEEEYDDWRDDQEQKPEIIRCRDGMCGAEDCERCSG